MTSPTSQAVTPTSTLEKLMDEFDAAIIAQVRASLVTPEQAQKLSALKLDFIRKGKGL